MSATGSADMDLNKITGNLLELLAQPADSAQSAGTPRFTENEWDALLAEAETRGLALLLYNRLGEAMAREEVPVRIRERLREAYLAAAARNTIMLHNAAEVLAALKREGIGVIALKGLYLAENVFTSIGLRTFSDLDLLVRRERLADALAALQGLGYKLSTWYDPLAGNTDIKHIPPLEKADHPAVELHWTILEEDEPFSIDVEGLWRRALPAAAAGVEVLALSLEDLILHLSMHFTYQHRLRAGLRNLYDIAGVLRVNADRVDWPQLLRIAGEWKAERVTWLTFRLLETVHAAAIPVDVMRTLQPADADATVAADALTQALLVGEDRVSLTPDLAKLAEADNPGARLRLVWQRVFIPRRVLAREYNADPRSPLIYARYIQRFFDLLRRYARPGWRLMDGDENTKTSAAAEQENARLHAWLTGGE